MKTHNEKQLNATGTSLQGYLPGGTTYASLVAAFGPPCEGDGYKVDAEWIIELDNGAIATVYNYKTGRNYNGPGATAVEDITDWHVGGRSKDVVDRVRLALARGPALQQSIQRATNKRLCPGCNGGKFPSDWRACPEHGSMPLANFSRSR